MATGISASYERHLNCSLCLEVLNDPRALPCLHTFCLACLQSYISSVSKKQNVELGFECPVCRTVIPRPADGTSLDSWASSFPPNYAVKGLLEESWCSDTASIVIAPEDVKEEPSSTTRVYDACGSHPEKNVDFFCEDHGVMCCSVCAALQHRRCDNVVYLLDSGNDIGNRVEAMDFPAQSGIKQHKPLSRLSNMYQTQNWAMPLPHDVISPDPSSPMVSPKSDDDESQTRRHKPLQRQTARFHDRAFSFVDTDLVSNVSSNGLLKELAAADSLIQHSDVAVKQKRRISSSSDNSEVSQSSGRSKDNVRPRLLRPTNTVQQRRPSSAESDKADSGDIHSKTKCEVSVASLEEIDVSVIEDKKPCNITGIAQLTSGGFLLADSNNQRLKLFGNDDCCQGQLSMPSAPWDVDVVGDFEAVVSVPEEMRLQLVLLDTGIAATRHIQLDKKCYGVCYCSHQFFVSLQTEVRILTYNGDMVKKIGGKTNFLMRQPKKAVFGNVSYLTVDSSSQKICVSDSSKNCVMHVNKEGHMLETYSSSREDGPLGLAVGPFECLFVCRSSGDLALVHFGTEGTSEKRLLTLNGVQTVHFSPQSNILYLSRTHSNIIYLGKVDFVQQKVYGY